MKFTETYRKVRNAVGLRMAESPGNIPYKGFTAERTVQRAVISDERTFAAEALLRVTMLTRQDKPEKGTLGIRERLRKFGIGSRPSMVIEQILRVQGRTALDLVLAVSHKDFKRIDADNAAGGAFVVSPANVGKNDERANFLASDGRVVAGLADADPALAPLVTLGSEGEWCGLPRYDGGQLAALTQFILDGAVAV